VAIKFEKVGEREVLKLEVAVLKKLQSCPYVVRFISCGRHRDYNYMVMELLGDNISELRRSQQNGRFSMLTTLKLSLQVGCCCVVVCVFFCVCVYVCVCVCVYCMYCMCVFGFCLWVGTHARTCGSVCVCVRVYALISPSYVVILCLKSTFQMLRAIEAVHVLGFLHRDIKPSNFAMGLSPSKRHSW
jgi:serine/threonine protein kinase